MTKKYASEILKHDRLLLLLDGFDEIKKEYRSTCLEAIGIYNAEAGRRYIISSRKNEYKEVAKDAPVWLQVEVWPLTFEQLEAELKHISYNQPEAPHLLQVFQNDPLLREAAQVPFYFNTLQLLFSGGKKLSDLNLYDEPEIEMLGKIYKEHVENNKPIPHGAKIGQARLYLEDKIVESFVEHKLNAKNTRGYKPEQVRHYLSFFASRLMQRNMVVFELVDLQYDWWKWNKWNLLWAGLVNYLAVITLMIIMAITMTEMFTFFIDLNYLLTFLMFMIFFYAPFLFGSLNNPPSNFETFEKVNLAFDSRIITLIIASLIPGLLYALIFNWKFGLLMGLFSAFYFFPTNNSFPFLQITTPYQRFIASAKALHFSILQHWLLRWQLYRAGVLPLRLVDFLNEMSERHILETDGATWRFRHRILQEYFAEQWEEEIINEK